MLKSNICCVRTVVRLFREGQDTTMVHIDVIGQMQLLPSKDEPLVNTRTFLMTRIFLMISTEVCELELALNKRAVATENEE